MKPDNNSALPENNDKENLENDNQDKPERFVSDTQKIVRRHLEDEEHQITDEEMANIRVGMNPPVLDEPTSARLEGEDAIEDVESKMLKDRNIEEDENTKGDKITPWDIKGS